MAKILILAKYWDPFRGGIEDNSVRVAKYLAKFHDVHVIAFSHTNESEKLTRDGYTLHRCKTQFTLSSQPISVSYFKSVVSISPDIVYFHAPNVFGNFALLFLWLIKKRNLKIVVMHHMDIYGRPLLRPLAIFLYNSLLRKSQRLIVTSFKNAALSNDIQELVETSEIPLGISIDQFNIGVEKKRHADSWKKDLCGSAFTLAFVGRHARYKGLDVLVNAIKMLPDVNAIIAGDGPYREMAEELAKRLGISTRVHFCGEISEEQKIDLLNSADVFVFPSTETTEAFGISQLEAMACGLPVVASDLPTGVTDVSIHEKTALLVPPRDHVALADAIKRIADDDVLAKRLANAAYLRVSTEYTTDRMVERNLLVIQEVLQEGIEIS